MNNSRALIVILFVIVFFTGLVIKLVDIQIIRNEEFTYYAQRQQTGVEKISAEKGLIYDRNNVLLVYNKQDVSFFVDLRMVTKKSKQDIAQTFSKVFGKSKNYYLSLLKKSGKTICIEKKVPVEKANLLNGFNRVGLFTKEEPTRIFHYENLASHVLGYVDNEYRGISGVSEYFKDVLDGEEGSRIIEKNAIGDIVSVEDIQTNPAIPGDDICLTINKCYQLILEDELRKGIEQYGGTSATGIIMDPNTGEILALSNVEDYDPNEYWKYNDFQRRNRAITDTYEPGSTFKSITLASLIDQKLCRLNEKINTENGKYKFKNVNIRDTHPFNSLSVIEVMEQSSNIGVAKLSQRIDDEKYFKYLRGFGFGNLTSITLPGETPGRLRKPNEWSKVSKAYLSFGYEISVTPLQLITAYSAIINGGVLLEPQLIERQISHTEGLVYECKPKEVRRVISQETSEIMRNILAGVVKNGTGKNANSEFISVGGKTGTSQKLVDGSYSKSQYNSSFIGFFPVDNPQVICLVLVNSPDFGRYGGLVAAPIFKNVAERIVLTDTDKFQQYLNPDILKNLKFAEDNIETDKSASVINGNMEIKQVDLTFKNKMPDLVSCSVRDGIYALTKLGIRYKVNGNGFIISQSINPGKTLVEGEYCILNCAEIYVKGASNN